MPPIDVPWTSTRSRPSASSSLAPSSAHPSIVYHSRGLVGGAVAARVEREQAVALLPKAVVDEAEVVPAEQPAAELEHDGAVLRPGQLVVEAIPSSIRAYGTESKV